MKKVVFILLSLLVMTMVVSCDSSNSEDVVTTSENSSKSEKVVIASEKMVYSTDVEQIDVLWKNNTDEDAVYGNTFTLEKKQASSWKKVEPKMSVAYNMVGNRLLTESVREHTYKLKDEYGNLEVGEYRISTTYRFANDESNTEYYFQSTYFA